MVWFRSVVKKKFYYSLVKLLLKNKNKFLKKGNFNGKEELVIRLKWLWVLRYKGFFFIYGDRF